MGEHKSPIQCVIFTIFIFSFKTHKTKRKEKETDFVLFIQLLSEMSSLDIEIQQTSVINEYSERTFR